MRTYETVFVLNPELGADAQTEQVEFYKDNITKNGGEILAVEPWGKLTLAYKIENHSEGVYTVIQFNATTEYIEELEKRYKFNENVLRYIVVQIDEKKFKLKPRKDPVKRERRSYRRSDDQPENADSSENAEQPENTEQPENAVQAEQPETTEEPVQEEVPQPVAAETQEENQP